MRHITIKHKLISNLLSEPCPPIKSSPQIISSPAKVPTPQTSPPIPSTDVCPPHCMQWVPNPGQTFKCNICYSIFPSIESHARHIIDVHPEQTNNICDNCPDNVCSNLEVADLGCGCPCDVCEERM